LHDLVSDNVAVSDGVLADGDFRRADPRHNVLCDPTVVQPLIAADSMPNRRFPAPWTFDEANHACFIVRDWPRYSYFTQPRGEISSGPGFPMNIVNSK
jgi:hypothetical protein